MGQKNLRGKNIGATKRSTGHYFLEGFLSHYGLTLTDINLHDVNAADLENQLEMGQLDAITSWEPHIFNAEQSIGKDNLTMMISPTPFRKDFYFTSKKSYAKQNSNSLKQFLSALIDAEEYIRNNSEEAKIIIAERLNADLTIINRIWENFTFEISLEQSILVNLEDEAVWAIKLLKSNKEIPNYLDFIDIKPLSDVKPYGVNIIH